MSGFELDIFTYIAEKGSTAKQVAKMLHLNEHACERQLNTLVSLGFLKKQDQLYKIGELRPTVISLSQFSRLN